VRSLASLSSVIALGALALGGCVTREVVYVQQAPTQSQVTATASVQVHINCEEFCSPSHDACRSGCHPQAWSPNQQAIQDHCESRCDFNRFSCVSRCESGQRRR
jgi:hypothetical protein